MFVCCIHNVGGRKPHSKRRENLSIGEIGPPHHFSYRGVTGELLCVLSLPADCTSAWEESAFLVGALLFGHYLVLLQEQRICCLPALQCIWAGMEDRGLSLLSSPLAQLRHFWISYPRLLAAFCTILTSVGFLLVSGHIPVNGWM